MQFRGKEEGCACGSIKSEVCEVHFSFPEKMNDVQQGEVKS
jgi:hypothetical protein